MAIGPFSTHYPPGCDPPIIYIVEWPDGEYAPARVHSFLPMTEERRWVCKWCRMMVHAYSLDEYAMGQLKESGLMETCAETVTHIVMGA